MFFFKKKEPKNFYFSAAPAIEAIVPRPADIKVFLLLFLQKKKILS